METVMLKKSKVFALRIIKLFHYLREEKNEFVLSKQLLRSGTSVGANLSDAQYAISKNDLLSKEYIALKECAETCYWLELLFLSEYLTEAQFNSLKSDADEIRRMLSAATKTLRKSLS